MHFTLIFMISSKYRIVFQGNLSTEASVEMVYILFTVYLFLLDHHDNPFLLLLKLLAFSPFVHLPISGMLDLAILKTECYCICLVILSLPLFQLIPNSVNIVFKAK